MERKANRFVHELAERLIKEHFEDISEAPVMKDHFTKAVEAMKAGKLKQELLTHMTLYAKKFCHIMLTHSRKTEREPLSPPLQDTSGSIQVESLPLTTPEQPSAPSPEAPHPLTMPEPAQVEETPELPSDCKAGLAFNLFASDGAVEFPWINTLESSELLSLLCVASGSKAFQLVNGKYFSGKGPLYKNLKLARQVLIGQKQPEITMRYLSAVVKNISKEVETALSQEDNKRCADVRSFINKLLMLTRFRSTITRTSFPENIKPSIDDLLAALLSISVDVGAIVSRSVIDVPKFAKQTVLQVLLHLDHSPSHQLDVLLQLTSSSKDAAFLEPLYRKILCHHQPISSNVTFIKFVCAVRQAKKILGSTIPDVLNSLVQEASLRSPPNLAVWLLEGSAQWLGKITDKSNKTGSADIVKYLLDSASENEISDLLEFLMTSEESAEAEKEEEKEDDGDLFFIDKAKDDMEGILPGGSEIFERDNSDEEDSDLEEQINLADELLAELDRGQLKGSDEEENERGSADEMENGQNEKDSADETEDGEDEKNDENDGDEDEKMEVSSVSPLAGGGSSGRVSPVFHFPQGQEVSFEEKRAIDLERKKKVSAKSPSHRGKASTGGVDEAGHGNKEDQEDEGTKELNSTLKEAKLQTAPSKDRNVSENGDDLGSGQAVQKGKNKGVAGQGGTPQKSKQQGDLSVNGQDKKDSVEALDKTLMHDVVPSSEIDESDTSPHHHERLSFPMLSEKDRKEDSPNRRRTVKKRKYLGNGEKNLFKSPRKVNNRKNPAADFDHDDEDENTGEKKDKEEEEEKKEEEVSGKEEEALEDQVSKFLKGIRNKTRKTVANPSPRRSSRIREASTSSTEGGPMTPRTKEVRRTRMSLRTRRSLQK